MKAIHRSTFLAGALAVASVNCGHKDDQSAHAKEPRATYETSERQAEERRAEERRADERRAEERRADERRAEERRAEERKAGGFIGGGPVDPGSAVARIASARCEREVRCNHVGAKQKYPNRAECVMLMQDDKRDEINEKDCPGGLDKKQLNACLVAIHDESCGNALDAINRLVACRASSICLK